MKKLMIAAAIVCAAAIGQAATASWSIDYSYKPDTETGAAGWVAYFFDNADVARDTFILSLGDKTYGDNLAKGWIGADLTDDDGYTFGVTSDKYGDSQSITGYFVLFNSDDAANATLAYVSETMPSVTGDKGGTAPFNFGDVTATQDGDNWTKVGAVPEPTSGLLLLIGVAGLALRRRRA